MLAQCKKPCARHLEWQLHSKVTWCRCMMWCWMLPCVHRSVAPTSCKSKATGNGSCQSLQVRQTQPQPRALTPATHWSLGLLSGLLSQLCPHLAHIARQHAACLQSMLRTSQCCKGSLYQPDTQQMQSSLAYRLKLLMQASMASGRRTLFWRTCGGLSSQRMRQ